MISVQIPDALEKKFAKRAAQKSCNTDAYIRQILENYLEEEEDYEIALQRLSDIESGKVKTVSLEEMEQRVLYASDH